MNRSFILGFFMVLFLPLVGKAQYISEILEYQPAPGQLINTQSFGSPQAAESIIGNINGLVSLGAFGGSITIKMEDPVQNDPHNPFGVDFTIFNNSMTDWSEAGAIQVMKDENQNGLADDTWYIIAGSDYYFDHSIADFQIEYFNPEDDSKNILWVDQNQDTGYIYVNSIHQNDYYPSANYFPGINQNSQIYTGFKIEGSLDQKNPNYIRSYKRGFGYADNIARGTAPYDIPDNPYTAEKENSGGDAIDISWARDESGQLVFLNQIHFIKISTAINKHAHQLGEISSEISGIIDVSPNPQITGPTKCMIMQDIPHRLLVNSQTQLSAILFDMGFPMVNQNMEWSSSAQNIAHVSNDQIIANKLGDFVLTVSSIEDPTITKSIELSVIKPQTIKIKNINQYLYPEDEIEVVSNIIDNQGFELNDLNIVYEASNEKIEVINSPNKTYIKALEEGECWLKASLTDFPEIKDSLLIRISLETQIPKVFVSIKTEDQTILARQPISIYPSDIEAFIEPSSNQFLSNGISPENLAQAIISTYQKMNLEDEFRFKNDLENGELYLWKVPLDMTSSLEYVYGYGGRTESPYERCWIVKVNEQNIVRDFQKVPIENQDEITIYHVNNINESWILKEFKSLNDSVLQKGDVEVQLEAYEMQMYPNAQVYTLDQWFISNKAVYDNNSELWFNDNQVFTNTNGFAEFQLNQLGDHIILADGEEIKIHIHQATGLEEISHPQVQIYPNPVHGDYINIVLPEKEIQNISIYNLSGQMVLNSNSQLAQIPVPNLTPGTYILNIRSKKSVYNQRFIKQ